MPDTVRTERDGRVLTVLFDAPPHNFIGRRMIQDLDALTRSLVSDRSLRAVVLAGARPGLFVTHYEIGEILAGAEGASRTSVPASSGGGGGPPARSGTCRLPADSSSAPLSVGCSNCTASTISFAA